VGTGVTVPYCRVDFTVSERGGPEAGYAVGQIQRVVLRVGLPANAANGGTGGAAGLGAWNGKVRNLGGGGLVGAVNPVTSATNTRYVGSHTDSGHVGSDPAFGVISSGIPGVPGELNLGTINDFFSESLRLQYQWALKLATVYYGTPATRNYWDGCSTGGRQGLVLATQYGNDFDGFLIGAPHTNHSRTSGAGTWRTWEGKELTGGTITDGKTSATVTRMINQCDAQDGVVDGLLSDPRTCHASAAINMCGATGAAAAPNCLNDVEAQAIDKAMEGAHNDLGKKVWVSYGRGSMASMAVGPTGTGGNGVYGWANKDMSYDWRTHPLSDWDNLDQLGTNTVGRYVDMGSTNLNLAKNNGAKILMWHGLADQLIPFQQNVYYYNEVVDNYGGPDNVSDWYRFFLAPGVTHCGGGVGPQASTQLLFDTMVNWRENGMVPNSILATNTTGGVVTRTRPLCPFPQTAIYDGVGDQNLASSFACGGNLQTHVIKCDGLLVKYKHETGTAYQPLSGEDDISCGFASMPQTTASVSPAAVNGWYQHPTVTLHATDPDNDLDHTEYRLDGASAWTTYTGPFPVSGDGSQSVEYRSTDKAEHVEPTRSLVVKIDTTAPVISGMPAPACMIWPPNGKLVQIAAITAADILSGLAPGSPSTVVTSNEPVKPSDIVIDGGVVKVRTSRSSKAGRIYTIVSTATDLAGNPTTSTGTCLVPHDQSNGHDHDGDDDHDDDHGKDRDDHHGDDRGKDRDDHRDDDRGGDQNRNQRR
jgi:hypothetical protein